MKVNERVITGYRSESYEIEVPAVYDEQDNIITEAHIETRTREVPVTEIIVRDMTEEELAAAESEIVPDPEPSIEDRVGVLESTTDDIVLLMADIIGGI